MSKYLILGMMAWLTAQQDIIPLTAPRIVGVENGVEQVLQEIRVTKRLVQRKNATASVVIVDTIWSVMPGIIRFYMVPGEAKPADERFMEWALRLRQRERVVQEIRQKGWIKPAIDWHLRDALHKQTLRLDSIPLTVWLEIKVDTSNEVRKSRRVSVPVHIVRE